MCVRLKSYLKRVLLETTTIFSHIAAIVNILFKYYLYSLGDGGSSNPFLLILRNKHNVYYNIGVSLGDGGR